MRIFLLVFIVLLPLGFAFSQTRLDSIAGHFVVHRQPQPGDGWETFTVQTTVMDSSGHSIVRDMYYEVAPNPQPIYPMPQLILDRHHAIAKFEFQLALDTQWHYGRWYWSGDTVIATFSKRQASIWDAVSLPNATVTAVPPYMDLPKTYKRKYCWQAGTLVEVWDGRLGDVYSPVY